MKTFLKRSVINLNFPASHCYDVINLPKMAAHFPAASNFAGPYVIGWIGATNGIFIFNWGGVAFTIDTAASTTTTKSFSDRFTATTSNPRVVFSFDSGQALKSTADIRFPSGSTNRYLVRLADEQDYLAGKYFRGAYLQDLVDLYPSAIRSMDWCGGVDSHFMRWEDRSLPTDLNWQASAYNATEANPSGNKALYGTTSGANIYTLAAIGSTPASEFHGHVVQCTIGTGMVRGGSNPVTNVTRANPGVATYTGADNYQNGDKVIFRVDGGMTELDSRICTVANVDTGANTFELSGLDTSGFTAWSGSDNGITSARRVMQYVSLTVGTWGEYPVMFSDGITPASNYANSYIATSDKKTFYFDKSLIAAKNELTGVAIQGAWIFNSTGSTNYHRCGVPPAVIVKFITELNAVATASGKGPIDLWINVPQRGMLSMDTDYSSSSNVAIQFVDLFLNGGDGVAAAPSNVSLFIELSNETWNQGFTESIYFGRQTTLRWGGSGTGNPHTYHALRHAVMVNDIRTAFPNDLDRIVFVVAGQGTVGVSSGNVVRMDGDATLAADPLYQSLGGGAVGTNHQFWDAFAIASYFSTPSAFDAANLATLKTAWVNGDAAAKEQAITDYLVGIEGSGTSETVSAYRDVKLPAYNTKMVTLDRVVIGYEGANEFLIRTTVNDQYNFLWAARSSSQWAALYRTWFDKWKSLSNAAMPGTYIMQQSAVIDHTWDHISYGYNDTYASGVEGGSLDLSWHEVSDYNNRKRTMRIT